MPVTRNITSNYRDARATVSDTLAQGDREAIIKVLVKLTSIIETRDIVLVGSNDILQTDDFRVHTLRVRDTGKGKVS